MFASKLIRWVAFILCVLLVGGLYINLNHFSSRKKGIPQDMERSEIVPASPTKPPVVSDTVEISRVELENLKIGAQSCNVLKHFSIVLIDTGGEVHKQIRSLVGTIHRYHEYEILIYVYALDLNEAEKGEIHIWRNVEYWDIRGLYQVSTNVDREENINPAYWKPIIFKHSAERLGKFIYIQAGYYLNKKLNVEKLNEFLESIGSFYADPSCNAQLSVTDHLYKATTFDIAVHGLKFNSFLYKELYTPLTQCARSVCTGAMKVIDSEKFAQLSDSIKNAMSCQDMSVFIDSVSTTAPADSACYIINREDFILSGTQLPGHPHKSWLEFTPLGDNSGIVKQTDDKRIHVALGIPTTSKGHKHVEENPLLKVLLPSLSATIGRKGTEEGDKYVYKLYLAIDRGDALYDNLNNQQLLKDEVAKLMKDYNFHFQIIRVINSFGWVPMLWNTVFHHAITDGSDYFYQLNDDVRFITPGWTTTLIDRLLKNPVKTNFGVTGPTDEGNRSIFTQAFVHKTHHKIFGYFYPYVFKNWYSDDWISMVYREKNSYFKDPNTPLVRNQQTFGTRYVVCDANGKENLNKVLQSSKIKIEAYLQYTK